MTTPKIDDATLTNLQKFSEGFSSKQLGKQVMASLKSSGLIEWTKQGAFWRLTNMGRNVLIEHGIEV